MKENKFNKRSTNQHYQLGIWLGHSALGTENIGFSNLMKWRLKLLIEAIDWSLLSVHYLASSDKSQNELSWSYREPYRGGLRSPLKQPKQLKTHQDSAAVLASAMDLLLLKELPRLWSINKESCPCRFSQWLEHWSAD